VASYKVLQGIDYKDRRAEAGDVVDDIPAKSIKWLVDQGIIEKVGTSKVEEVEPEPEPVEESHWSDNLEGDDL